MTQTITKTVASSTTHVAGYIRLTRDESLLNNLSAPAQRKGIAEYAQRAGLSPLRVYEETKAIGGDTPWEARPEGSKLIAAIRCGEVKHVVFRDLDRATRSQKLGLELIELCRTFGVTLHTFTGPIPMKSASDKFAFHIRSAAAEFEKNQTGDRVRKAKQEAVAQGRWQGPPSYGFTSQAHRRSTLITSGVSKEDAEAQANTEYPQKARLYVNPDEARVLRRIYDLALAGMGSRRIITTLNKEGHRTRTGCCWSTERLSRTLNNPAAAGYLTFDVGNDTGTPTPKQRQKLFKGKHEAIVTLEEWQKIQEMRAGRTDFKNRRGDVQKANRRYVLSGIIRCACGSPMRGKSIRARDTAGRYVCARAFYHGKDTPNGCSQPATTINAQRVHEVFWKKLRGILTGPDLVDKVYAATQRILREEKGRKAKTNDLTAAVNKVETQITLWYARHDGTDSDVAREAAWRRILELTQQKKDLLQERDDRNAAVQDVKKVTREQIAKYLGSIYGLVDTYTPDQAQAFVQSLVDHHGLSVKVTGPESIMISLAVKSPGVATSHVVHVETEALMPKDRASEWAKAESGKHLCGHCGKPINLHRRHFWKGVPRFHASCHSSALGNRRETVQGELLSGEQVAKALGIGRSTVGRWLASGRLPEPQERRDGMLLWHPSQLK